MSAVGYALELMWDGIGQAALTAGFKARDDGRIHDAAELFGLWIACNTKSLECDERGPTTSPVPPTETRKR